MQKVSIVVPVYNVELYLAQCLESLITQMYDNIEIVLVDDGSTDSSGCICDEYAAKDKRILVIHQKNAGAANAKNVGLDIATGELITFIDSDDFVDKTWILDMVEELHRTSVDMVECAFDMVYKNRTDNVKEFLDGNGVFSTEQYLAHYLDKWTNSLFWNKLFKRSLTEEVRFKRERRCIDDEFYTYKVISNAETISRIDKPLYHYRQRGSSAVRTKKNQLQITDDALEVLIERYEWMKERFPTLRKIYLVHDIDFLLYFDKQGTYDEKLVKKYRKIVWYYLKECFGFVPDKIMFVNIIRLLKNWPSICDGTEENVVRKSDGCYFE